MALSTHIPKEITDYKERIVGDFSGRQLIALTGIAATIGISYFGLVRLLHVTMSVYPYIAAVLCAPIFAFGFYRKSNMPFEQYINLLLRHYLGNNKFHWSAEPDIPEELMLSHAMMQNNDSTIIEEDKDNHVQRKQKRKKASRENIQEVRCRKKQGIKATRKAIRREIKAAKKEYRAAKRQAKKEH